MTCSHAAGFIPGDYDVRYMNLGSGVMSPDRTPSSFARNTKRRPKRAFTFIGAILGLRYSVKQTRNIQFISRQSAQASLSRYRVGDLTSARAVTIAVSSSRTRVLNRHEAGGLQPRRQPGFRQGVRYLTASAGHYSGTLWLRCDTRRTCWSLRAIILICHYRVVLLFGGGARTSLECVISSHQ